MKRNLFLWDIVIAVFWLFVILQVYKSASKRKAHILKNHPGAELPPSIRKLRPARPGEPDPMLSTHTQLTGTIATAPVCCPHCAKQYSSKVCVFVTRSYSALLTPSLGTLVDSTRIFHKIIYWICFADHQVLSWIWDIIIKSTPLHGNEEC